MTGRVRAGLGSARLRRMGRRVRRRVSVPRWRQAQAHAVVGVLALGAVLVWTGDGGSVVYSPDAPTVTDTGALVCVSEIV